ncbi:hypothetical protein MBLNU230_g3620t1 [Neophaeotheca triangularis]
MAEVAQWRRKVPGGRPRPAAANEDKDTEAASVATTPKKRVKPKLSSYFTSHSHASLASLPAEAYDSTVLGTTLPELPSWPVADPFPDPDPDSLVEGVMIQLMEFPLKGLDPKFNNILMRIFECYRHLKDDLAEARTQLDRELDRSYSVALKNHAAEQKWEEEKALYKDEVKRLEIIISKSNRGLAGVTMARQESVLRRKQKESAEEEAVTDRKETVLEFLEGTKLFSDRGYSSQRATMKAAPRSPSYIMKRLSRKLTKKSSSTRVHQDLPFGTPPRFEPSTLAEASMLDEQAEAIEAKRLRRRSTATSENNMSISTFSGGGDMLPDEFDDTKDEDSPEQDPDLVAIRRIATTLSRRRGISAEAVLPHLFELFREQNQLWESGTSPPELHHKAGQPTSQPSKQAAISPTPTRRKGSARTLGNESFMSKASGFMQKFRLSPQVGIASPIAPAIDRRFSFDFGDDAAAIDATFSVQSGNVGHDRALRKSASTPALGERAQSSPIPEPIISPTLPPLADVSLSSASHRASKIPSPAYIPSLARPRQDREDSSSSLMTAIKHSDDVLERSGSKSSSRYSGSQSLPMRPNNEPMYQGSRASHGSGPWTRDAGNIISSPPSNRLIEHTSTLRSSPAAAAAAAAAAAKAVTGAPTRDSGGSNGSNAGQQGHGGLSTSQSVAPPLHLGGTYVSAAGSGDGRAKENVRRPSHVG